MKWQRKYKLTLELAAVETVMTFPGNNTATTESSSTPADQIVVQPPFTIQFQITRSVLAGVNSMNILIYNLNEQHRNRIFADRFYSFQQVNGQTVHRRIVLQAGYDQLSTIFQGSIMNAYSYRQGSDIITAIQANDFFDINTTQFSQTYQAGTAVQQVITNMGSSFPNVQLGAVSQFDGELLRAASLDGNCFELMKKYAPMPDAYVFVDLNKVNVLKPGDIIEGEVIQLDAATGLLNSPQRADAWLTLETLFEPRVIIGQLVNVQSSFFKKYNGTYKVCAITHQGTISEAVSGDCRTTFGLLLNNQLFGKSTAVKQP